MDQEILGQRPGAGARRLVDRMRHSPGTIKMPLGGVLAILESGEGTSVSIDELPQFLGPGHGEQVGGGREGGCRFFVAGDVEVLESTGSG